MKRYKYRYLLLPKEGIEPSLDAYEASVLPLNYLSFKGFIIKDPITKGSYPLKDNY